MRQKAQTQTAQRPASAQVPPGADRLSAPVWIELDLSCLRRNLAEIRAFAGPGVEVMAVVKANAYGHGLLPVARALEAAGVSRFGVAHAVEGVLLREHGFNRPILVLGQILPEEAEAVVRFGLVQAVGDFEISEVLNRAALRLNRQVNVHLKVDTGMGRYGVWHTEAEALARRLRGLPALKVEGVFSHLALAGQSVVGTLAQINRFRQAVGRLEKAGFSGLCRHVANSIGLVRFPKARWDLVRTGLLLYGVSPLREGKPPFPLQPALALKSKIRFIKTIEAGQTVSYGGTYRAVRSTRVATIPVGYAHGYPRALSNRAHLLVRGRRAPVIGRVTMEDLMADVTNIEGASVGDEAVLIGRQGREEVTTEELAKHARTIPYEILAGLSPAIPRFAAEGPE